MKIKIIILNINIEKYYFKSSKYIMIKIIIIFLFIITIFIKFNQNIVIKVALCTMGKNEHLYIKEFIDYYIKLGIDHIFIYDDNDKSSEKFSNYLNIDEIKYVTIYENIKRKILNQSDAFTDCYKNNKNKFNWILMVDMDEFLYVENNKLKNYLMHPIFNKCDFIKFHWVHPTDNNNIHYENKSLFERFQRPYKKSIFIKSIIRGNISNLKYWVHSPYISPIKNITCNNIGQIIKYEYMNFEGYERINIKKAYIIHFNYKSTEEFINKFKRGYSNWFGKEYNNFLNNKIEDYFRDNKITKQKIDFIENELKLNLSYYRKKLND